MSEPLIRRISELEEECKRLRAENETLRRQPGTPAPGPKAAELPLFADSAADPTVTQQSSVPEKIRLFRSLFRGREDVYAQRWEGRDGKAGYSPAAKNPWDRPKKKGEEDRRQFLPLTDTVIFEHLSGKQTIGVYTIRQDDSCCFLAVDFDKAAWERDAVAYMECSERMGVPAALERSRSGNGGHVWIFFEKPVPARLARRLGAAVLTRTMHDRPELELSSYDRFFPNQDTMPKGGFGNLIALPLQHAPRACDNSVFVDSQLRVFDDQWAFLSQIRRLSPDALESLVSKAERGGQVLGVQMSASDAEKSRPWEAKPSRQAKLPRLTSPIHVVQADLLYVQREGLPAAVVNQLLRLAAFQNPEFYKAQAMRLNVYDKPRIISCADMHADHIALPRGCLGGIHDLASLCQTKVSIDDKGLADDSQDFHFTGALYPDQKTAADELLRHDMGVLAANTAFGKTVVAIYILAQRQSSTLILVHRKQLLDQWHERLQSFLDLPAKAIGGFGGGRKRRTGTIDIAMIQSLNRKGEVKDFVAEYGQIIVDECHHISAFSFEQVMRRTKARYVLGLTATPTRKDGHQPVIFMQCGPIRHRVSEKAQAGKRAFLHRVLLRDTGFSLAPGFDSEAIHDIYWAMTQDPIRNGRIASDVIKAVQAGRSPLVLTERREHLDTLVTLLKPYIPHVIILQGGMKRRELKARMVELAALGPGDQWVLIATGRFIGEGFDFARLDTLFLAHPISWKGTLQQYAGRLHRDHADKVVVEIYDYLDRAVPMLMRMFMRRSAGYRAMGYEFPSPETQ